jgi:hypothetical protein
MTVILDGASGVTHNLESDPMSVFYQSMLSTYKLAERTKLTKKCWTTHWHAAAV